VKKIVRFIFAVIKYGFVCFAAMMVVISLTGLHGYYGGGLWGLFLIMCAAVLLIAAISAVATAAISLEEWLEDEE